MVTPAPRLGALVCAVVLSGLVLTGTHAATGAHTPRTTGTTDPVTKVVPTATTTFPGAGTGTIADPSGSTACGATASTRNVTFDVSTLPSTLADVSLSMTLTHDVMGDLSITLIAPDGTAAPLAARPGATTTTACGFLSNYNGTYTFDDRAAATVWTAFGTPTPGTDAALPAGTFRASSPLTGAATSLTAAFAGLATPNGRWTLRVTDTTNNDNGAATISAAALTLVAQDRAPCQKATAAVVAAQTTLTAAADTLAKAKKRLKKAKRHGAGDQVVAKALRKARKARKANKKAELALDQALAGYYAVC